MSGSLSPLISLGDLYADVVIMRAALYLNAKLPRAYRTKPFLFVGAFISAGVLIVFAGISGWGLYVKISKLLSGWF